MPLQKIKLGLSFMVRAETNAGQTGIWTWVEMHKCLHSGGE